LLVSAAGMATALDDIVTVVRKWVGGGPRTVKVTIAGDTLELSHATRAQQAQMVESFLERHRS
jgi:hypothetical protein